MPASMSASMFAPMPAPMPAPMAPSGNAGQVVQSRNSRAMTGQPPQHQPYQPISYHYAPPPVAHMNQTSQMYSNSNMNAFSMNQFSRPGPNQNQQTVTVVTNNNGQHVQHVYVQEQRPPPSPPAAAAANNHNATLQEGLWVTQPPEDLTWPLRCRLTFLTLGLFFAFLDFLLFFINSLFSIFSSFFIYSNLLIFCNHLLTLYRTLYGPYNHCTWLSTAFFSFYIYLCSS